MTAPTRKRDAGAIIADVMQWAWDCGLLIRTDHKRMFSPDKQYVTTFGQPDPSPYNLDCQMRKREECWPVICFTHPMTNRSQEIVARDWDEMWQRLEHSYKHIFAELGCPEWPWQRKQEARK